MRPLSVKKSESMACGEAVGGCLAPKGAIHMSAWGSAQEINRNPNAGALKARFNVSGFISFRWVTRAFSACLSGLPIPGAVPQAFGEMRHA